MKIKLLLTAIMILFVCRITGAQTERLERMWYTIFPAIYFSGLHEVEVDDDGFIYATGYGYNLVNPNSTEDYFTVKLDPVTGDTIWTAIYTRASTGDNLSTAIASNILIDSSGNVYVTGKVAFQAVNVYDVVTIKYSPDGEVLWIAESGSDYRGAPADMKFGPTGNIYIAGGGNILKYSPSGQLLWGINNLFATVSIGEFAVDSDDNIIVTGYYSTQKFRGDGTFLWMIPNDGGCGPTPSMGSMTVDGSGNVYVGGYTCTGGNHKIIRKYSPNGVVLWTIMINTNQARDYVENLLLDDFNNLYAGGRSISFSPGGGNQLGGDPIRKYTTNGELAWVGESPGRIAGFLGDGSIISFVVSGEINPAERNTKLKEFSGNGDLLDTAVFLTNTNFNSNTSINSALIMQVDENTEQIVTAGRFSNYTTNWQVHRFVMAHRKQELPMSPGSLTASFVLDSIRLNFTDNSIIETGFKLQRSSNSGASWNDVIMLPEANEPYPFRVITTIHNTAGGTGNLFRVCAFNDNGFSDWTANNGVKYPSTPTDLTADYYISSNSVALNWRDISRIETGYKIERRIGADTLFQEIGMVEENVTGFVDDQLPAPVLGEEYSYRIRAYKGNVYSDYSDIAVVAVVPVELISFSASVNDRSVELSWVTATETNNMGFEVERSEMSKVKSQMSNLNAEWEKIGFADGYGTTTETKSYSFTDNEVVSGNYKYRLKQIDFDGTFEYSDVVEVEVDFLPKEFVLEQNYPNPFNPGTKISWQSPVGSRQTIKVYDVLGNEVVTLIDEYREAGKYDVEFSSGALSSGVYFYRLQIDNYTNIKKMVLIK